MRIPNSVIEFAGGSDKLDLYKKFSDYYNHYRAINFGRKDLEYDKTISFDEKTEKMNQAIKEKISGILGNSINTEFSKAVWNTNPNYRWVTMAVINSLVDSVLPDTIDSTFGRFAETRFGGFGDNFSFDIESNTLLNVTKNGNSKRHVFAQRDFVGQQTLQPVNRTITVEVDLYRVLAGKENLARYASKVIQSIETEISYDIYYAINNYYGTLGPNYKEASYTQDTFNELVMRVTAKNRSIASVFGTKYALSKVLPDVGDSLTNDVLQEYIRIGYYGTFAGTNLFEIPQVIDPTTDDFMIDNNKLYVISSGSQKLVKLGIEGDTLSIEDSAFQNANLTIARSIHKKWAAALCTNSTFGIIDVE